MPTLVSAGTTNNNQRFELWALPDGRLRLIVQPLNAEFTSQVVIIHNDGPRFVTLSIYWSTLSIGVGINHHELLQYGPDVLPLILELQQTPAAELSINDSNANAECQQWIQNRKLKFTKLPTVRSNRRQKTIDEQTYDLRASICRLRNLLTQVLNGQDYLLGTLAGEMRASVYWTKDALRESGYNPLLLRMANLSELPLPVYFVPNPKLPMPVTRDLELSYEPGAHCPRIVRLFTTDKVCDLQQSLRATVLTLGEPPGRAISTLELISELANTMGASHYDADASEFLDVLQKMRTSEGNHVKTLMCETADVISVLSEWVLSELKARNLIA